MFDFFLFCSSRCNARHRDIVCVPVCAWSQLLWLWFFKSFNREKLLSTIKSGQRKAPPAAPLTLRRSRKTDVRVRLARMLRYHCSASHEMWNFILFPSLSSPLAFQIVFISLRFAHCFLFSLRKIKIYLNGKNKNIDGMCGEAAAVPRYAIGVNCSMAKPSYSSPQPIQ